MIPELLKLYHTEIKEREDSIKESYVKEILDQKAERKKELTKWLKYQLAEDKGDIVVNFIFTFGEEYTKCITLGYKKCITSFYSGIIFPVPMKFDKIK